MTAPAPFLPILQDKFYLFHLASPQILWHFLPINFLQYALAYLLQNNEGNAVAVLFLISCHCIKQLRFFYARSQRQIILFKYALNTLGAAFGCHSQLFGALSQLIHANSHTLAVRKAAVAEVLLYSMSQGMTEIQQLVPQACIKFILSLQCVLLLHSRWQQHCQYLPKAQHHQHSRQFLQKALHP